MTNRHVVQTPKGSWAVRVPNQAGPESLHKTQSAAERAAKTVVRREGGGEVVIHRENGKIRDSDTVAPARDPNPPKDEKH